MENFDYKKIGRHIANLRRDHGLSQFQLGKIVHVTDKTISKWETGDSLPDLESFYRLSKMFNQTVDEMIRVGISNERVKMIMLIDKSDELFNKRHDIIEYFNQFLVKQKNIIDETVMSVFLFNSLLYTFQPTTYLNDINLLTADTYKPSGKRALYDACGNVIEHYTINPNANEKKLMIIFSSGNDNGSKRYTKDNLVKLFNELKEKNWEFIYINPINDRELGEDIYNYGEHEDLKDIFSALTEWVSSYRSSGILPTSWLNKLTSEIKFCKECGEAINKKEEIMDIHMRCYYKFNINK